MPVSLGKKPESQSNKINDHEVAGLYNFRRKDNRRYSTIMH